MTESKIIEKIIPIGNHKGIPGDIIEAQREALIKKLKAMPAGRINRTKFYKARMIRLFAFHNKSASA